MRADVPDMGAAMLVITDAQPEKAAEVAEELGREWFEFRGKTLPPYLSANAAITKAMADAAAAGAGTARKPSLIIDTGDNPGGGNPVSE